MGLMSKVILKTDAVPSITVYLTSADHNISVRDGHGSQHFGVMEG